MHGRAADHLDGRQDLAADDELLRLVAVHLAEQVGAEGHGQARAAHLLEALQPLQPHRVDLRDALGGRPSEAPSSFSAW
jgi:hypothetical protein